MRNHFFLLLILPAALVILSGPVLAQTPIGPPVTWAVSAGGNGNRYQAFRASSGIGWASASSYAAGLGGHLATVASAAENSFVASVAAASSSLWHVHTNGGAYGPWIGGVKSGSTWGWVNGETFSYTHWFAGEPNNGCSGVNEEYIQLFGTNSSPGSWWNDLANGGCPPAVVQPLGFIVELPPAPPPPPPPSPSACLQVTTNLAAGSGPKGTMFDVVNLSSGAMTVTGLDQNFVLAGTANMEIYTRAGSWQGFESTAAAWTLAGTATGVVHPAAGTLVRIPIVLSVAIPAGATQAFYVTATPATASNVAYSNSTANALIGSDPRTEVRCGVGKGYLFGATYPGQGWNGRVRYAQGTLFDYETNSPAAWADFDGVQSNGCEPAVSTRCVGDPTTVTLASTNLGYPWELLIGFVPIVPRGGGAVATAYGQLFNVNLADPGLTYLNGLTLPPWPTPFGVPSPVVLVFPAPQIPFLTGQMLVFSPTHPDLFELSQAGQLTVLPIAGTIPGPSGDDTFLSLTAGVPVISGGECFIPPPLVAYGSVQSLYHISTNGRITWPFASNSFTPTIAAALTTPGMIGAWADFNTDDGGAITVDLTGGILSVNYDGIAYDGLGLTASTFSIRYDTASGVFSITDIAMSGGTSQNQFLGMSFGLGATNAGPAVFSPPGAGITTNSSDMIYDFGVAGTLTSGASSITFVPNAFGNYNWFAL